MPRRIATANGIPLRVCALPESLGVGHNTLDLAALGARGGELRRRYVALYEGEPTPIVPGERSYLVTALNTGGA
ncbi:hypothetical protein NKG94_06050 [Micromonospora sp. M12]